MAHGTKGKRCAVAAEKPMGRKRTVCVFGHCCRVKSHVSAYTRPTGSAAPSSRASCPCLTCGNAAMNLPARPRGRPASSTAALKSSTSRARSCRCPNASAASPTRSPRIPEPTRPKSGSDSAGAPTRDNLSSTPTIPVARPLHSFSASPRTPPAYSACLATGTPYGTGA